MVLKEPSLTVSTVGGYGDPEELIFNSFYCGRVWSSGKNLFLSFATLQSWHGPEI